LVPNCIDFPQLFPIPNVAEREKPRKELEMEGVNGYEAE